MLLFATNNELFKNEMCPCLLVLQLAFISAEHFANVLAEQLLQPPMKSTVTSLFIGEETGLRKERRPA